MEDKVKEYLQALEERQLEKCMEFYRDDAEINFHLGHYSGKQDIERWHKDRFEADMRIVRVDTIKGEGNKVVLKGAATSKKLKAWKINDLSGSMTILFKDGKIQEVKFGMRLYNPLEGW
ncbi:MAG: nuclear transport factor 2 family protein [Pseudomonadota bacterium]